MDGVSWIKLDADILDNRKIKQIRKMPEGFAIIYIWLGLLTVAAKSSGNGFVYFTEDIPYTEQLLSNEFDIPVATIQLALKTFEHFHMIEIVNDVICISNWSEYQNVDGLNKIREQGRKRVQAYRERQKIALEGTEKDEIADCNVTCNVTGNVTVTDSSYSISNISNSISNNKSNKSKDEPIDNTPVVFQLLLNDGSYYDVHQSEIDELKDTYPNANIEQEFKKMIRWIKDNPTKRKTKRGVGSFISKWLDKAQNQYHAPNYYTNQTKQISIDDTSTSFATPVELKFDEEDE